MQCSESNATECLFFLVFILTGACPLGQEITLPLSESSKSERLRVLYFGEPMVGEISSIPMAAAASQFSSLP